jgi:hypothetical protein
VKIIVKLNGTGGELDRVEIEPIAIAGFSDVDDAITDAVTELAKRCTLAIGDTITITEED